MQSIQIVLRLSCNKVALMQSTQKINYHTVILRKKAHRTEKLKLVNLAHVPAPALFYIMQIICQLCTLHLINGQAD